MLDHGKVCFNGGDYTIPDPTIHVALTLCALIDSSLRFDTKNGQML